MKKYSTKCSKVSLSYPKVQNEDFCASRVKGQEFNNTVKRDFSQGRIFPLQQSESHDIPLEIQSQGFTLCLGRVLLNVNQNVFMTLLENSMEMPQFMSTKTYLVAMMNPWCSVCNMGPQCQEQYILLCFSYSYYQYIFQAKFLTCFIDIFTLQRPMVHQIMTQH